MTVTLEQIHQTITERRRVSPRQVSRWIKACGIKPVGTIRTSPLRYACNAAWVVMANVGIESHDRPLAPTDPGARRVGIVKNGELRRLARKARGK